MNKTLQNKKDNDSSLLKAYDERVAELFALRDELGACCRSARRAENEGALAQIKRITADKADAANAAYRDFLAFSDGNQCESDGVPVLAREIKQRMQTAERCHQKSVWLYRKTADTKICELVGTRGYVLGDSTVCPREDDSAVQGWVDRLVKTGRLALPIINRARGGWSFKGMKYTVLQHEKGNLACYTDEENSSFGQVISLCEAGDFVIYASTSPNDLWQVGYDFYYIEDEYGTVTTVPEGTPDAKKYTWTASAEEYYVMLKDCLDKTLALGAIPVLVTACGGLMTTDKSERSFQLLGETRTVPVAIPGKITSCVEHFEEIKRILASEYEGKVYLIDYAPRVFRVYEEVYDRAIADGMSANEALTLLRKTYNASETDPTHQNLMGASLAADKIAEILSESNCPLKQYLREV